ncbi:MAG: hypothetical protein IT163_11250 [Bryobacterales bacterium]|nr:hypothetical protein [Bryobacterales bacterium]
MRPGYLLYGLLLVGGAGYYNFRGLSLSDINEVRNVPKSVRDNPGSYRSHYGGSPRYFGGK